MFLSHIVSKLIENGTFYGVQVLTVLRVGKRIWSMLKKNISVACLVNNHSQEKLENKMEDLMRIL